MRHDLLAQTTELPILDNALPIKKECGRRAGKLIAVKRIAVAVEDDGIGDVDMMDVRLYLA